MARSDPHIVRGNPDRIRCMMKVIISLGGSLIYPDDIDTLFIKNFRQLILEYLEKGFEFAIICGGGKLARDFQAAAEKIVRIDSEKKDWLGIDATKLNASLIKTAFGDKAHDRIISDPTKQIHTDKKIIIGSGWKPGWSTDYDAVLIAKNLKADMIVNMSNITHVYDSDPRQNKEAKKLDDISWPEFRRLVGEDWSPGLNMPFDPIASKEAEKSHITVKIIGKDLDNLKNLLDRKRFIGTTIS